MKHFQFQGAALLEYRRVICPVYQFGGQKQTPGPSQLNRFEEMNALQFQVEWLSLALSDSTGHVYAAVNHVKVQHRTLTTLTTMPAMGFSGQDKACATSTEKSQRPLQAWPGGSHGWIV